MHNVLKPDGHFRIMPKFQFESRYLSEYFGIWSIYEPVFRGVVDSVAGMNLFAHVASQEIKQDVQSRDNRSFQLTDDGIAVIQIRGAMMKSVPSMGSGTSTIRVQQQLHDARRDPAVLGAMLVMETPGGTVNGNTSLCKETAKFAAEKPLYAFIDDMTASAGVSVASQATKRFANHDEAIYGSMGTYGVLVDYSGNAESLGIKVHVIRAGDFKGAGTPGTAITEEQLAESQRIVNRMNEAYLFTICRGLSRSIDSIRPHADGRAIFAKDAVEAGLINGVQSYEQTYSELLQECRSKRTVSSFKSKGSQMQPATLAELKSKFPKSSAEWREKQLEAEATIADAAVNYAAYVDEQRDADRKAHQQELVELKAKADAEADKVNGKLKTAAGSLGHRPIKANPASQAGDDEFIEMGDPIEDFNAAVNKVAGPNADLKRRQNAIRQVANAKPELYQAYLLACNPGKRHQRLIAEKLEAFGSN